MTEKAIASFVEKIESLIDVVGGATLWVVLAMIALVTANVLLRYAFSFGSVWAQELEWHLLAALILLGICYALQRGENVRVDLFYANYSPRKKFIVDVISLLLLLIVALIFVKVSIAYVAQAWSIGEASSDPGGIPYRWAVKSLIPVGYGLLAVQCFAALIRLFLERHRAQSGNHV
jgi:TRAP-type mannitol/chloroaromatic compound transport system permease small subunit